MNFETYAEGYTNALLNVQSHMEESINRNGGAKSPQQLVNVFNDVIVFLHQELQQSSRVLKDHEPEEETKVEYDFSLEEVLSEIFGENLIVIKGGKN